VRRATEKWPTEYKLQYDWKNPITAPAPLLQAQEAVSNHHHHPACPNKPADQNWSAESVDGDSHNTPDSDQDSPTGQEPTLTAANRPATDGVKKRRQPKHQKKKAGTQPTHGKPSRAPRNMTSTRPDKYPPAKARNQPQGAPNKTAIRKMIEQDNDASGSDTDSQTGQKIQPQQSDYHYKCGHKKRKKRGVKRKLVWPMITEYQSQFKTKEVLTVVDADDDKVCINSRLNVCILIMHKT